MKPLLLLLSLLIPSGFALVAVSSCSGSANTNEPLTPNEDLSSIAQALTTGGVSVLTQHNDIFRTGAQTKETILTPSNVGGLHWQGTLSLDGRAAAQPLYVTGVNTPAGVTDLVYVATTNNTIYSVDPSTANGGLMPTFNSRHVGTPGNGGFNGDLDGIVSTPVIDPLTKTIYFVAHQQDRENFAAYGYQYWLYAVDPVNFNDLTPPVRIGCSPPDSPSHPSLCTAGTDALKGKQEFFADDGSGFGSIHQQRPALLFDGQRIFVAFGQRPGEGGPHPYAGWLFAFNKSDLSAVGSPYCSSRDVVPRLYGNAGIWQWYNGPVMDYRGRIHVVTGDGRSFLPDGTVDPDNDGYSVVQLLNAPAGNWTGRSSARWTPPNAGFLLLADLDLGSGGPVTLPYGRTGRLLVGGKQGHLYVFDTNNIGGGPVQDFQGAFNEYGPSLDQPAQGAPYPLQPGAIRCDGVNTCLNRIPISGGQGDVQCLPSGYPTGDGVNTPLGGGCQPDPNHPDFHPAAWPRIHTSQPHLHGTPVYWNSWVYWWAEKDYPRAAHWNAQTGLFDSNLTEANSAVVKIRAPGPTDPDNNSGMPGGKMSLSANGSQNGILFALVPSDAAPRTNYHYLRGDFWAFDANVTLQGGTVTGGRALFHITTSGWHDPGTYPTISGGKVFIVNVGCDWCGSDKGELLVYGL